MNSIYLSKKVKLISVTYVAVTVLAEPELCHCQIASAAGPSLESYPHLSELLLHSPQQLPHFRFPLHRTPSSTLHYITLQTIYSGLSKSNFKDHYGDAATQQCLGMIAEIN